MKRWTVLVLALCAAAPAPGRAATIASRVAPFDRAYIGPICGASTGDDYLGTCTDDSAASAEDGSIRIDGHIESPEGGSLPGRQSYGSVAGVAAGFNTTQPLPSGTQVVISFELERAEAIRDGSIKPALLREGALASFSIGVFYEPCEGICDIGHAHMFLVRSGENEHRANETLQLVASLFPPEGMTEIPPGQIQVHGYTSGQAAIGGLTLVDLGTSDVTVRARVTRMDLRS